MSKNVIKNCYLCMASLLFVLSCQAHQTYNDQTQLANAYYLFESSLKSNSVDQLERLFINDQIPLNTVIRTVDDLRVLSFPLLKWLGFLKKATMPYELRISNPEYFIGNKIGYSIATFDEYINGEHQAFGVDLFFYLKSAKSWKMAALNNTATLLSNPKDSPLTAELTEKTINKKIDKFINASNAQSDMDSAQYISTTSTIAFRDKEKSNDWKIIGLDEFLKKKMAERNEWQFKSLETKIIDKHMALITAQYSFNQMEGVAYISLIATKTKGALISAIFLDV